MDIQTPSACAEQARQSLFEGPPGRMDVTVKLNDRFGGSAHGKMVRTPCGRLSRGSWVADVHGSLTSRDGSEPACVREDAHEQHQMMNQSTLLYFTHRWLPDLR